jgi:hypothetical protein
MKTGLAAQSSGAVIDFLRRFGGANIPVFSAGKTHGLFGLAGLSCDTRKV